MADEHYEDLSECGLSAEMEQRLLDAQRECVFSWTNKAGEAVGVIVSYFNHEGKIWMTCAESRARVAAIRRFPRASVCITSSGTELGTGKTITYKGDCVVHKDPEVLDWFIPAFAADRRTDPAGIEEYAKFLRSPGRVAIEFIPDWKLGFDSQALWERSPAAATDKDDPRNSGMAG